MVKFTWDDRYWHNKICVHIFDAARRYTLTVPFRQFAGSLGKTEIHPEIKLWD